MYHANISELRKINKEYTTIVASKYTVCYDGRQETFNNQMVVTLR